MKPNKKKQTQIKDDGRNIQEISSQIAPFELKMTFKKIENNLCKQAYLPPDNKKSVYIKPNIMKV